MGTDFFAVAVQGAQQFRDATLPRLACENCRWRGTASEGFDHWQQSGHAVTYRGHVQSFQRVLNDQRQGKTPIVRTVR